MEGQLLGHWCDAVAVGAVEGPVTLIAATALRCLTGGRELLRAGYFRIEGLFAGCSTAGELRELLDEASGSGGEEPFGHPYASQHDGTLLALRLVENSVGAEGARVLGEFLFRAIGSARTAQQFHVLATGVTRFALGKHDVKNAVVALPPVEEQQSICRWITNECQPLDDAIARTEEEIKLIREYRDRLIADVVTGQVDVRGWQPDPDDVVDDAALAALGDDQEDVTEEEDGDGED